MRFEYNRLKYIRVQRIINIKIAKAFLTASNEALCTLTGITPVVIKVEEAAKLYKTRGTGKPTRSITKHRRKIGSTQQAKLKSQNNQRNKTFRSTKTVARENTGLAQEL